MKYMILEEVTPHGDNKQFKLMKTSIIVQNLRCGGCANTITKALASLATIQDVSIDVSNAMVSFQYQDFNDSLEVKSILEGLGYPSVTAKNNLKSKATSFISCATGRIGKIK